MALAAAGALGCIETDLTHRGNCSSDGGCPTPESTVVTCVESDSGVSRTAAAPVAGDLVISEIMPAPAAVPEGECEWFELYAVRDIDLKWTGGPGR